HVASDVDHLGVARVDFGCNSGDLVALDQHVALWQIADLWIHRNHRTTAKQQSVSHDVLLLGTQRWWNASTWRRTAAESNHAFSRSINPSRRSKTWSNRKLTGA